MFYVQVKNGKVVNRAEFKEEMPSDWEDRDTWYKDDSAQIGWEMKNGKFTSPPPFPTLTDDELWQALRDERDRRLTASDWTQVADAPVDADAWMRYRQELRDLPETITDPTKVIWPAEPARTT